MIVGGSSASPQPSTSGNPFASSSREQKTNEYTIVNTASTMRVLNVLRHWLTKHPLVRMKSIDFSGESERFLTVEPREAKNSLFYILTTHLFYLSIGFP